MPSICAEEFATENRAATELAERIREQVASGALRPGDRLLSERKLSQRHRVPLHAVRQALGHLKREGLVRSRSKSGVYVTKAGSRAGVSSERLSAQRTPPTTSPILSAQLDGFHLLDAPHHVEHELQFLVTNWNARSRPKWERLCRTYNAQHPHVRVTPIFPSAMLDYECMRTSCDMFLSCHQSLLNEPVEQLGLAPFERSELEPCGIAPRYLEVVETTPGQAFGVPVSACLLLGFINRRLMPDAFAARLHGAATWEQALEVLIELAEAAPDGHPLNFCPFHTFNLSQFITLDMGGMLDGHGRFDLHRPELRRSIELAADYLDRARGREALGGSDYPQRPCLSVVEYSYRSGLTCTPDAGWEPWLYPLGSGGKAIEAINFGVINRQCLHVDEAKRFLLYVASPEAQALFADVPGEYSISDHVGDPFHAYPPEYREALHEVRRRAAVLREFVPGYFAAVNALRLAGKQWFHRRMTAEDLCQAVDRHRQQFLDRHPRAGEPDQQARQLPHAHDEFAATVPSPAAAGDRKR